MQKLRAWQFGPRRMVFGDNHVFCDGYCFWGRYVHSVAGRRISIIFLLSALKVVFIFCGMINQNLRKIDASILVSEGATSRVGISIKNRQFGQLKDELAYQTNIILSHNRQPVSAPSSVGRHQFVKG